MKLNRIAAATVVAAIAVGTVSGLAVTQHGRSPSHRRLFRWRPIRSRLICTRLSRI